MKVIGITGGIASGKSYVSKKLIDYGYKIIDCDTISRELTTQDEVIKKIQEVFGDEVIFEGKLIRKKLGKIIFQDYELKEKLENILHPLVVERVKEEISKSNEKILFVDCPLLYEANLEYLFYKIIVVYIDRKTQEGRLMERDNISLEYTKNKIESQMPLLMKKNRADYIIDNSFSNEKTNEQIEKIVRRIKNEI